MKILSNIKRIGYVGTALVLALATVPIFPSGKAQATDLSENLTLEADSNECYTIPMDKTVTLDLSGHTLNCGVFVEAGATLTVTGNGTITTNNTGSAAIYNKVGGTVVIENGTFNSTNWYTIKNLGTMSINGGTFTQGTANASNASMIANGWYDGRNGGASDQGNAYTGTVANMTINGGTFNHYTTTSTIKSDDYSKTTINGGTFTSQNGYLVQATGDVTVNGGDFTGYGSLIVFNATGEAPYEPGVATITDATVNAKYLATGSKGVLAVEGGTFTGLERIVQNPTSVIEDGIVGGVYNIPVDSLVADGKAVWKIDDDTYEVLDESDAKNIFMLAEAGVATTVEGLSERVRDYSDFKVVGDGTFENGAYTPAKAGVYNYIRVFPRVCKKDNSGDMVCGKNAAEDNYEATIYIDTYGVKPVNKVLSVGEEDQLPEDTVTIKADHMTSTYSVEDETIATVDTDGKITAKKPGTTKVYATITGQRDTSVEKEIGAIRVYDFSSIAENYLVKVGGRVKIDADATWDLTATTTSQNVNIVKNGNNFRINGASTGLAEVNFAATIGDEEKTTTANVYVYNVNDQDVLVRKGESISDGDIEGLIDKGHDDVVMRVKSIENGTGEVSNESGLALTGVEAGDSVVTYRLSVGENDAHANVPINVHVWDFVTENLADEYDLGNLKTATDTFKVYDNGGEISYSVKDENGEEVDDVVVTLNGDEYTIAKADNAKAGEYTIEFVDTVMGEEVASKTVTVRVHEIIVDPSEDQYIVMSARNPLNNEFDLAVNEKNEYSSLSDIGCQTNTLQGISLNATSEGFKVKASAAGAYTITCSDAVASAEMNVYVIDFTVDKMSYHLVAGDTTLHLVEAINEYWNTTEKGEATDFTVWKNNDREYAIQLDENTQAGDYTVEFYAYANGEVRQTRTVKVFVYEMETPEEDLYIGYTGDRFSIEVTDKNTHAYTRAKVIDGDKRGLRFNEDYTRVRAMKPGVYTVRYTDYMANGNIVGTYEATIVVIEVEEEELFVRRGETLKLSGSKDWSASFATDDLTGVDYEAEDDVIVFDTTDMELGMHEVYIAHDFTEFDEGELPPRHLVKVTTVVVYDVAGTESDDMTSDEDRTSAADFVAKHIAEMIKKDTTSKDEKVVLYTDIEELKDMLREGVEITVALEVNLIDEEDWEYAEAYNEVIMKIEDESGIVAMYEAYLCIYANGEMIGLVYELDDAITMRLEIPEEYRSTPDGYTRTFTIVRGHEAADGTETAEVIDVTRDGNFLVFKNDKFSSFAISYTDTLNPVAPNTGFVTSEGGSANESSNLVVVIALAMNLLIMISAAVFAKQK